MTYFLLVITFVSTVAGQLMLKKGLLRVGAFRPSPSEVFPFLLKAFGNPFIIISVLMVAIASVSWIFAVSRAELGHTYPLMGISYIVVALGSALFFHENITFFSWLGISLISVGVILLLMSKGH